MLQKLSREQKKKNIYIYTTEKNKKLPKNSQNLTEDTTMLSKNRVKRSSNNQDTAKLCQERT